jgi:diguanylate cyclase (GGDEF)-like protein
MPDVEPPSGVTAAVGRWCRAVARATSQFTTIRGRILIAFLIMSVITGILGGYATMGIRRAGVLVDKTFDESLMSINYARAAAADFSAMQAAFARRMTGSRVDAREADQNIETLQQSLADDLEIAGARSQSSRAANAAAKVQKAARAWTDVYHRMLQGAANDVDWDELDRYASIVDQQIDLLVNYTAGDAFLYRQRARAAVAADTRLNIAGTALAVLLSGLVAWLLAHRIIGPVAAASAVAGRIADGQLDGEIPQGSADELGALLAAMRVMRENIKTMMQNEVAQRRSAQARLADALESSSEGIVVVALANRQAMDFLGRSPDQPAAGEFAPALAGQVDPGTALSLLGDELLATGEVRLPDGRWLRVSRNTTQEGGFIVVYSDISLMKEQEATLKGTNLRLDAALDNMLQGLCLYDADNRLQVVNHRFCEIFGLPPERIQPGITFRGILELSVAAGNYPGRTASELLSDHTNFAARHATGTRFQELRGGRVVASTHRPTSDGGWVVTHEDVTDRRQAEAKIMHMAGHDALTNLPNRILFREQMEQALTRVDHGEAVAVLYLDLDRFKGVNDTLGHPIGDALLCKVTERLREVVRGTDTVARLGGDEFAILQIGAPQPTGATILATRVIEAIEELFDVEGHQVVIGASIGIAVAPNDGTEPDQLLKNADMALYRAKSTGRGTYHFFQPEMDAQMQARRILELDLRKAFVAGQFELYYQPFVDLVTNKVSGFEALVRWNHPERGLVPPDEFIPLAEEIGLIAPLGEWVLKNACLEAATWPDNLSVAVNLSPAQLRSRTFVFSVVAALKDSHLAATRLELEITETVLLQNTEAILQALHQIRQLGVRIAMDDFGTGYSSLSYLRSFPFDKIKIDRSFVGELDAVGDSVAIIRAVTGLAGSLGMTTTAEGVETEEQLDILRMEGCTHVQGYLFSWPRPTKDIPALLRALEVRGARATGTQGLGDLRTGAATIEAKMVAL